MTEDLSLKSLLRQTREDALIDAERAIVARVANYPQDQRAGIAATHMAALAVRRLRTGETATEINPSFAVVPREPIAAAVARALSTASERCHTDGTGLHRTFVPPTADSMRAALIEYAEKGND